MEGGVGPPTVSAVNNDERGESQERQVALIVSAVASPIDYGRLSPTPREGPSKEKMGKRGRDVSVPRADPAPPPSPAEGGSPPPSESPPAAGTKMGDHGRSKVQRDSSEALRGLPYGQIREALN
jgi:hypothetical protein